ncbi:hypothetical protein RB653_003924 [Dictyostelium firmibasis]|uniref:3-oxoacyl-[acyl-carrier-protein] reductase n=1 Tax=Dictyostelium firmibasis TaxID=79012 RepID=A0AAN7U6J2_9MYCE
MNFLIKKLTTTTINNNNKQFIQSTIRYYSSSVKQNGRMENKVCFVTGGASGIGLGIVEGFLKEGAKVAVADIDKLKADNISKELNSRYPGSIIPIHCDVGDETQISQGIEETARVFGGLDVLVSNAGFQHIEALETVKLEDWRKMMAIHLDGAFLCTKHAIKEFKKDKRGGAILYMGSVHSKYASEFKIPYVTAKHGLEGLCRGVAREYARDNIRSNLICPGFVLTPLVKNQIPHLAKKMNITEEEVVKRVLLKETVDGEFTTVEEIAEVAVNLCAIPSKCLTGQSLLVSHGWIME